MPPGETGERFHPYRPAGYTLSRILAYNIEARA